MIPDAVVLDGEVDAGDLTVAARALLAACVEAGMPSVRQWSMPSTGRKRKRALDETLARLKGTNESRDAAASLAFDFDDRFSGWLAQPYEKPGVRRLNLGCSVRDGGPDAPAILGILAEICRLLLPRISVRTARVEWSGGGLECLVDVPIARSSAQLVVTSESEVESSYDDSSAFWRDWDARSDHGDRVLLTRAVEARDSVELLERLIEPTWEMARAAKPGLSRYYFPKVRPEEREVYLAGESPLEEVGYLADEKLFEMSCVLPSGRHVPGWQIHRLSELLGDKKLPDGRPLEAIRVVFLDKAAAEQERRPLLDVGVQVFWMGTAGELVSAG